MLSLHIAVLFLAKHRVRYSPFEDTSQNVSLFLVGVFARSGRTVEWHNYDVSLYQVCASLLISKQDQS